MKQLCSLAILLCLAVPVRLLAQSPDEAVARKRAAGNFGKVPLVFEENRGHTDPSVRFLSRGPGYTLFLTGDEAVLRLSPGKDAKAADVIRMRLEGGRLPSSIMGEDLQAGTINRFIGRDASRWTTGIRGFGKVRYTGVYPGVDAVYYGNQNQLEYDFVLAPGVDPSVIRLRFDGARGMRIDASGDLVLRAKGGEVRQPKPVVYQTVGGVRHFVDGRYILKGRRVGFAVGAHDRSLPLVIDPVLSYATYLGGNNIEQTFGGLAADAQGNVVIVGRTFSANFPTTAGASDTALTGVSEVFVTKLNAAGTGLVYSTFLGGSSFEDGFELALDAAGNAYVGGNTQSTDFPTTPGAVQTTYRGSGDAFLTKINPTGTGLVYSTYIGGTAGDYAQGRVAVDGAGNAYVTGLTQSTNFPVSANAWQPSNGGDFDGFLVKLNSAGSAIMYATYLGGTGSDSAGGVWPDAAGNVYVAGNCASPNCGTTSGAFQTVRSGSNDAFVVKIGPSGAPAYATLLGGSASDGISRLLGDASGSVWVTGNTGSTDFPTTAGAFQAVSDGSSNGFITKLNPAGDGLVVSTLLGGSGNDSVGGLAVDVAGNVYVGGFTTSANFPVTPDAHQATYGGGTSDAFLAVFNGSLSSMLYGTFLGGTGGDLASGLAIDPNGGVYISGTAGAAFPSTAGAFQPVSGGNQEIFIAKFIVFPPAPTTADAGPDQTVDGCASCLALVTLHGSGSAAGPSGALTFTWTLGPAVIATTASPTVGLPVGIHSVTLTVGNGSGLTSTDTVVIAVQDAVGAGATLAAQLQASLDAANATIQARDVTIAGHVAAIAARDATIAGLQADLSAASAASSAHVATIAARDATIADQVTTIASRDATIAAQVITIADRDATIASQAATVAARDASITGLQSDLAAANTATAALQTNLDAANATIATQVTTIAARDASIAGLQSDLAAANTANVALQNSLSTANATIAIRNTTIAQLQSDLNLAGGTIAAQASTIATLQASLAACTASNPALQAQVTALQAQVTALQAQIASLGTGFQQVFNDPAFVIPGATPQQQLQNLVTAIGNLNHGQQQALYKKLGGKK